MDLTTVEAPSVEGALESRQECYNVGGGAFREVYRTPGSFWCYKFDDEDVIGGGAGRYADTYGNLGEWLMYQWIVSKYGHNLIGFGVDGLAGVRIPLTHMLENGVIAMQYIEPAKPVNWGYLQSRRLKDLRLDDLHGGNVVVCKDNYLWIVDLGSRPSSFEEPKALT